MTLDSTRTSVYVLTPDNQVYLLEDFELQPNEASKASLASQSCTFAGRAFDTLVDAATGAVKSALAGVVGGVASYKLFNFTDRPFYEGAFNCKTIRLPFGFAFQECLSTNRVNALALGVGIPMAAALISHARGPKNEYGITKVCKAVVFGALWGAAVGNALSGSTTFNVPVGHVNHPIFSFTIYEKHAINNTLVGAAWGAAACGTAEVVKQVFNAVA